jgi:nickel-dependent lactate racemase
MKIEKPVSGEVSILLSQGEGEIPIVIPETNYCGALEPLPVEPILDGESEVVRALENPIGTRPLSEVVRPGERIIILVSSIDRLWIQTYRFLPTILNQLNRYGISDDDISVIIASGTVGFHTRDDQERIVGAEVLSRIPVHYHDCREKSAMTHLGRTTRGTEVWVNRLVVEADRRILTGGIVHHLGAGFGGGRKSILPGVSYIETIEQNHKLHLRADGDGFDPELHGGKLKGNPQHEDMVEIAEMAKPDFLFNVIINAEEQHCKFVAGHFVAAWKAGVEFVRRVYARPLDPPADIVLTDGGPYTAELTMSSLYKYFYHAALAVHQSGVVIMTAKCGTAPAVAEFDDSLLGFFRPGSFEGMERELRKNFTIPGYAALLLAQSVFSRDFVLVSNLEGHVVRRLGVRPAKSVHEALAYAFAKVGKHARVFSMPRSDVTLPVVKNPVLFQVKSHDGFQRRGVEAWTSPGPRV